MALKDVKSTVTITTNAVKAVDDLQKLKKLFGELKQEIEKMKAAGDTESDVFKDMNRAMKDAESRLEGMKHGMELINDVLDNLANKQGKDVNRAIREVAKEFGKTHGSNKAYLEELQQKLDRLKEDKSIRQGLIMPLKEAEDQLNRLNNASLDKLKMGLETINKELAKTTDPTREAELKGFARQYQAQIAVKQQGPADNGRDIAKMNADQLRAEQARLRTVYQATDGAKGYETVSQEYLTRLQAVNQQLQQMNNVDLNKVFANLDDQPIEKLEQALKQVKEQAAQIKVGDETQIKQTAQQIEVLEAKIAEAKQRLGEGIADALDFDNLQDVPTEKLEQALKQLEQQEKRLIGTDTAGAQKMAENKRKVQEQINRNRRAVQDYANAEKVAANTGKHNVTELKAAYETLQQKLMGLNTSEKQAIKETRKQMDTLKKAIAEVNGEVTGLEKIWRTAVRNIATYVGVFAGFNYVKGKIMEMVRGNIELSDSMAQVQKVTGLTKQEVDRLNESFVNLDTRTSITQLNDLAYSAGKMGIGKYGLDAVRQFVEATNQLQVALGDDLGSSVDESITPLAKLAENLGMIQKMGVERSMLAIGSSINELSQTTTAAGANIVDFARRIQPAAQMIGLTTDEILALGSASDSFGVSSEISATAFTKFLASYRTNTAEIERILGMTRGTLDAFFDQGRTMDGLLAIFQRMHEIGDLRYLEEAFKALGSEGSRMFTTFGAFSKNIDMFREHLTTSTVAFNEATSVTREYNLVQDTAAGIVERANNIWEKAFVNPKGVDTVKELAVAWYDLTQQLTQSQTWLWGVKAALESVAFVVGALIKILPVLIRAMMFYGIAAAIRKVTVEWHIMRTAVDAATTSVGRFSAFMRSNIWVLGATAIAFAATALIDMAAASDKAAEALDAVGDAEKKAEEQSVNDRAELKRLYEATKDTTKSIEERKEALRKMVGDEKYKQYKQDLSDEQVLAREAAKAYGDLTNEIIKSAKARAYQQKITELTEKNIALEDENEKTQQYLDNNKGSYESNKRKYQEQQDYVEETTGGWTAAFQETQIARQGAAMMKPVIIDEYEQKQKDILANQEEHKKNDEDILKLEKKIKDLDITTTPDPPVPPAPSGNTTTTNADKTLTDKFNEQKQQAEGLIAKIDQWYNLQDATINDFVATGKITSDEADKAMEAMKIARNTALEKARLAVASGDDIDWKKFYGEQMSKMMVDHGEWSTELFAQIGDVDIQTLHNFLSTLQEQTTDPKLMAKLDASSFFDTMKKKAAESRKVIAETQAKATEELNKMLLKYEYFDQASRQFASNLIQIGALGTTAEQMAQGMEGAPSAAQTQEAVRQLLAQVVRQGSSVYAVNPADAQGVADMLRQLTTSGPMHMDEQTGNIVGEQAQWFDLFPALKDWMENPEEHKRELEDVFNVMLQAEQGYYEKRKQSFQNAKTEQETRFRAAGFTDQEAQTDKALESQGQMQDAGIGATFAQQIGLGSIADDPEVQRIQNRIYWRGEEVKAAKDSLAALKAQQEQELQNMRDLQQAELEALQSTNATEEQLDLLRLQHKQQIADAEAQMRAERMGAEDLLKDRQTALFDQETALATKVAQELRQRVQTINNLTKPIQDGAKNIGQKFGEMIRGVEEDSMTWKEIWHSMAVAVGESVIDMTAQYAQNLIMEKAMNAQSKQEAIDKATVDVAAGTASGAAKTIGTLGWWGIALIPVIAALLKGLLNAAFASNKSSDTSNTTTSASKMKLVSGMLTYDQGNADRVVSSPRRKLYDDGSVQVYDRPDAQSSPSGDRRGVYPGTDGHIYRATPQPALPDGVQLIRKPIATTVNGQPSLVAERGPEIIIGRRATRHIQMNEPGLLHHLAAINGRYRTYDQGTVPAAVPVGSPDGASSLSGSAGGEADARVAAALEQNTQMMLAMQQTIAALSQTVTTLQQRGIPAHIQKYGTGGLIDEVKSGLKFDARYNR